MKETTMRVNHSLGAWWAAFCSRAGYVAAASLLLVAALPLLVSCAAASQTSAPKATATPAPVVEGPLGDVVAPVAGTLAHTITTEYDTGTRQAKITLTIAAAPDVATAQSRVMALCFEVQKTLWTSNQSLREVKVIVLGPIRDDYANIIDDAYGVSDVFAPTAATLQWGALSPESAWARYDNTWLRPSYTPNWLYGKNNG
jgi:hypothetical protein